jgi:hypothetical protein
MTALQTKAICSLIINGLDQHDPIVTVFWCSKNGFPPVISNKNSTIGFPGFHRVKIFNAIGTSGLKLVQNNRLGFNHVKYAVSIGTTYGTRGNN